MFASRTFRSRTFRVSLALVLLLAAATFLVPSPALAQNEDNELVQGVDNLTAFAMRVVALAILAAGVLAVFRSHIVSALVMILIGAIILAVGGDVNRLIQVGSAIFDLIFGG